MRKMFLSVPAQILVCATALAAAVFAPIDQPKMPGWSAIEPLEPGRTDGLLFLGHSLSLQLGVASDELRFPYLNVRMKWLRANSNPSVSYGDPLPGLFHLMKGPDPQKWRTSQTYRRTASLQQIYPGVDARLEVLAGGALSLRLILAQSSALQAVEWEIPSAASLTLQSGNLYARVGVNRQDPSFYLASPIGARWEVRGTNRFGLAIDSPTSAPFEVVIPIVPAIEPVVPAVPPITDAAGNTFFVQQLRQRADEPPLDPLSRLGECGMYIFSQIPCLNVGIFSYNRQGELRFATVLAGRAVERASYLTLAPGGSLLVAGATGSDDFPVSPNAAQTRFAGPVTTQLTSLSNSEAGDLFISKLDASTGLLLASTYLGGPEKDLPNLFDTGADGSVTILPRFVGPRSGGLPTTAGALFETCSTPCISGYAARLEPSLNRLIYGTYLPGGVARAKLAPDGVLHFVGGQDSRFVTTPDAAQRQPAGGVDGTYARLNPTGTRLLYATYLGTPISDDILFLTLMPDGGAWVQLSSFVECCVNIDHRLVRFDGAGKIVADQKVVGVGDIFADAQGTLHIINDARVTPNPDAPVLGNCGFTYLKWNARGEQIYATYMPFVGYEFSGVSPRGNPLVNLRGQLAELIDGTPTQPFLGCLVDSAQFVTYNAASPGGLITLFGSQLGPQKGVSFQLENGRLPLQLAGTRVTLDGTPLPLLYASYGQVNAIIPYTATTGRPAALRIEVEGKTPTQIPIDPLVSASIRVFQDPRSDGTRALAINEDGTLNSPQNPARPGQRIVLYATGGGQTSPPSTAGEVTPLEIRPLATPITARTEGNLTADVEYAGAAPGLISGVLQINLKLPPTLPTARYYGPGTLAISIGPTNGLFVISAAPTAPLPQ